MAHTTPVLETRATLAAPAVWHVTPLHPPRVWRPCPRCGAARPFASRDRFRLNANGRRIDIWLVYGCTACGATWNREVVARRPVRELDAERVQRMKHDDPATAWACAFDVDALSRAGMRIDGDVPFRVARDPDTARPTLVRVRLRFPLAIRLDRLLADGLGLSRSAVARMDRQGAIGVSPARKAALRKPASDGQQIELCWERAGRQSTEQGTDL